MLYISRVVVAGMMRRVLKASFPATKFRVNCQSYAGGGCITVKWADGPTAKRVEALMSQFEGSGFDGMIDMPYAIHAWLLNGEIIGTQSSGTESSRGSVPSWGGMAPHDDAELVHFGSGFVFCERTLSAPFLRKVVAAVASAWGLETPDASDCMFVDETPEQDREAYNKTGFWWGALVHRAAEDRSSVMGER